MSTLNNPGAYDCLARLDRDEPYFLLRGRDPMAGLLVKLWVGLREEAGEDPAKVAEALACAGALDTWAMGVGNLPLAAEREFLLCCNDRRDRALGRGRNLLKIIAVGGTFP